MRLDVDKIEDIRWKRRLNKVQMAQLMGMSGPSYHYLLKTGLTKISLGRLAKIAQLLSIDPKYLLK